jgi:hypothetical protein
MLELFKIEPSTIRTEQRISFTFCDAIHQICALLVERGVFNIASITL